MYKSIILLTMILIGCGGEKTSISKQNIVVNPSWVTIETANLKSEIRSRLANEISYPDETIDFDKIEIENRKISDQIYQAQKKSRENCKPTSDEPVEINNSNAPNFGNLLTLRRIAQDSKTHQNKVSIIDAERCLLEIEKDESIIALRKRAEEIEDMKNAKNKFDESIRIKSTEIMKRIIAEYAEDKGIELILELDSNMNSIQYSRNKAYLNVTADVMALIQSKKQLKIYDTN